jgi:hypothetical protein
VLSQGAGARIEIWEQLLLSHNTPQAPIEKESGLPRAMILFKMLQAITCLFSIFVRRSRSDSDAKKGGWPHHRGLEADLVCLDFPIHQMKFPVPDYREFDVTSSEMLGNLGSDSLSTA